MCTCLCVFNSLFTKWDRELCARVCVFLIFCFIPDNEDSFV